jgi:hypothetical protein
MAIFEWLKAKGYEYVWGVKLGGAKPDIVAFNSSEIVALEFNKTGMEAAVHACLKYLKDANRAYILTKTDVPSTLAKRHGIGLIKTNHDTKLLMESKRLPMDGAKMEKLMAMLRGNRLSSGTDNNFRQRIVEILRQHPEGMTIMDVSSSLKAHRHTSTKYVNELIKEGTVVQRNIGPAKLCYLKKAEKSED